MAETEKPDRPYIAALTCIFSQDSDSDDDNDLGQELSVKVTDAGAGPYLILETQRWAIDNMAALGLLLERVRAAWEGLGPKEKLS